MPHKLLISLISVNAHKLIINFRRLIVGSLHLHPLHIRALWFAVGLINRNQLYMGLSLRAVCLERLIAFCYTFCFTFATIWCTTNLPMHNRRLIALINIETRYAFDRLRFAYLHGSHRIKQNLFNRLFGNVSRRAPLVRPSSLEVEKSECFQL